MLSQLGLCGEISRQHLLAFGVHDSRVGGATLQDFECRLWFNADLHGELKPFRQYRSLQAQYEIEDQLHSRSGSARPEIEDLLCEDIEEIARSIEGFFVSAHEYEYLSPS